MDDRHNSRNVICCPRKTIVRDRSVARDGREDVSVRADLERILAGKQILGRKYQGFLRGTRGRGNNFNHSRRAALMFYEDSYAFLWSVESQFVLGNRTLFFRSRNRVRNPVPLLQFLSANVEVAFVCTCTCNGFLLSLRCLRVTEVQKIRVRKESRHWYQFRFDCVSELKQIMEIQRLFISLYQFIFPFLCLLPMTMCKYLFTNFR